MIKHKELDDSSSPKKWLKVQMDALQIFVKQLWMLVYFINAITNVNTGFLVILENAFKEN